MTDKTPEDLEFDNRYTQIVTQYGMVALKKTELEEQMTDLQEKYSVLLLEYKAHKDSVS